MAEGESGSSPIPVRVFISYRREDTRGYAGRLYDSLLQRLAPSHVFMDIDNIEPGVDFVDVLTETVQRADVELVLIGPQWVDIRNARGQRRLDDPNDYVRLETEEALRRGIRVIPLLFGGAVMPSADELPPTMAALSRRNALEISDARWRFDTGRLLDAIEAVGRSQAAAAAAAAAQAAAQAAAPAAAAVALPSETATETVGTSPEPAEAPIVGDEPAVEEPVTEPPPAEPSLVDEGPAVDGPATIPGPEPRAVTEPIPPPPGGRRRWILLGGAGAGGVAVVATALILNGGLGGPGPSPTPSASGSPTTAGSPTTGASAAVPVPIDVTLAVDMPSETVAERIGWAVALAVTDREAELLAAGYIVSVTTYSHGVDNAPSEGVGLENVEEIVANPAAVAMVGPRNTRIAVPQLPITNAAGLPQCSPGSGYPPLTRPDAGALTLRAERPEQPNFFRPIASDDLEGSAAAQYALDVLGADSAFVVTDMSDFGDYLSDGFRDAFAGGGGVVAPRRDIDPAAPDSYASTVALIGDADVVFLGTDQTPVAAAFRGAMAEAGLQAIPLLAGPSIVHAPDAVAVSYFELAGEAAPGTYAAIHGPVEAAGMADFSAAYQASYGEIPNAETAVGYACGQVLVQALIDTSPAVENLREVVRAAIVGSGATFDTVLGTIGFDANGDTLQPVTRILRADPAGAGGAGDWVLEREIDQPPPTDLTDARARAVGPQALPLIPSPGRRAGMAASPAA